MAQADPTKVELLNKEFEQKRNQLKSNLRDGEAQPTHPAHISFLLRCGADAG